MVEQCRIISDEKQKLEGLLTDGGQRTSLLESTLQDAQTQYQNLLEQAKSFEYQIAQLKQTQSVENASYESQRERYLT